MRRNRLWLGAALALSLAVVVGSVLALTRHGTHSETHHGGSVLSSTRGPANHPEAARPATAHGIAVRPLAHHQLKNQPVCPPPTGTLPATVDISTTGSNFTESCYYAAADQALTIDFTSSVVAEATNVSVPLTLLISPSQNPAVTPIPGTPMGIGNESNAVFVGTPVSAPNTVALSVPALTAGTYDLQVLQLQNFIATLVVQ